MLSNAFTVTAFDGSLSSSPAVQVNINVQSFGHRRSILSGPWIVNNSSGAAIGLGQISQNGSNLTLVNANGISSRRAVHCSPNQVVASNFDNHCQRGRHDRHQHARQRTHSLGRRHGLAAGFAAGPYSVSSPGISSPTLASITQNGLLTLVNGSNVATATIANTTGLQLAASGSNSPRDLRGRQDRIHKQRPSLDETRFARRLQQSGRIRDPRHSEWHMRPDVCR